MNFDKFTELIKKNSEKGKKTEFMKIMLSIDDYRSTQSTDYGIEETFLAEYDKKKKDYIIYYPDKEDELHLSTEEVEDEFYNNSWGSYLHK